MALAWWETMDFDLSEKEKEELHRLTRQVVERMTTLNMLDASKKLGTVLKDYRKTDRVEL
jgi:hypothetical protein